jgi:hypothetical protein
MNTQTFGEYAEESLGKPLVQFTDNERERWRYLYDHRNEVQQEGKDYLLFFHIYILYN